MSFIALPATQLVWTKYSVSHTLFQAAALTKAVTFFTLPIKSVIMDVIIRPTTPFAGTTTYTLSAGIAGTLEKYVAASDVKAAVTASLMYTVGTSFVPLVESFTGGTAIQLNAVATVDNLDQSSAGAADIYVLTALLP